MRVLSRHVVHGVVVSIVLGDVLGEGCGSLLVPARSKPEDDGSLVNEIRRRCASSDDSAGGPLPVGHLAVRLDHGLKWFAVGSVVARDGNGRFLAEHLGQGLQQLALAGSPHVALPALGKIIETAKRLLDVIADEVIPALTRQGHAVSTLSIWCDDPKKAEALAEHASRMVQDGLWVVGNLTRTIAGVWLNFMDAVEPHHAAIGKQSRGGQCAYLGRGYPSEFGSADLLYLIEGGRDARVEQLAGGDPWRAGDEYRRSGNLDDVLIRLGVPLERLHAHVVPLCRGHRARAFDLLSRFLNFRLPDRTDLRVWWVTGGCSGCAYVLESDDTDAWLGLPRFAVDGELHLTTADLRLGLDEVLKNELADNAVVVAMSSTLRECATASRE